MKKNHNLQENYLNTLRNEKINISIYLVNGIKLTGLVSSFDNFCIVLKSNQINQMIYKHAISTIVPSQFVSYYEKENEQ